MLLVGARHFGWRVGVPAGLLAALAPVLLPIERIDLPDPDLLYACGLFAGAALLAEGAVRGGDRRWLAASGVAFGLSAYVKPAAQPLHDRAAAGVAPVDAWGAPSLDRWARWQLRRCWSRSGPG